MPPGLVNGIPGSRAYSYPMNYCADLERFPVVNSRNSDAPPLPQAPSSRRWIRSCSLLHCDGYFAPWNLQEKQSHISEGIYEEVSRSQDKSYPIVSRWLLKSRATLSTYKSLWENSRYTYDSRNNNTIIKTSIGSRKILDTRERRYWRTYTRVTGRDDCRYGGL